MKLIEELDETSMEFALRLLRVTSLTGSGKRCSTYSSGIGG